MVANQITSKTNEPPLSLALLVAGVFVCVYGYISNPLYCTRLFYELDQYADHNLDFLTVIGISFILNIIWVYSIAARTLGLQKQGSRLEVLTGKSNVLPVTKELKHYVISILIALIFRFYLASNIVGSEPFHFSGKILQAYGTTIQFIVLSSLSVSVFVLTHFFIRLSPILNILNLLPQRLPKFPRIKNTLVLGSIGESENA